MTDWKERPTSNASKFVDNEKLFSNKFKDSYNMLVFYKRTHSLYRLPREQKIGNMLKEN